MQLKTKLFLPVLTVIIVLGLTNTAFAQLSCGVASTPVSRDTATGLTEVAGDLILACLAGATPTTTASITVSYGVTITDSTAYPAGLAVPPAAVAAKTIGLTNTSGSFTGAGLPTIASVNNAGGQIVINIPAQAVPATGSFTLTGVLVALSGTGITTLNANLSVSPGNNVLITAGQNVATVITQVLPGLKDPTLTFGTSAGVVLASGIAITPGFSTNTAENYIDMLRQATQFNSGTATNDTQLVYTFSGIPTGVTLGGCTVTSTSGTATLSATTLTPAANTLTVSFTAPGLSLTTTDSVTLACATFTAGATATVPLTPGSITMQVTLGPAGAALGVGRTVLTSATAGQIPRYTPNLQPATPLVVLNIISSQTNILLPFATSVQGYDTGIAIANTTSDPYGTAAGAGGARAQTGNVTFTFYPQTGTSCSFTPSTGAVGVGLNASGAIPSGGTLSVLLSQLLAAAPTGCNFATGFTGYVFIVTNFTNAHAAAFVTNFTSFTSGQNTLILPPPSLPGFSRSAATFESLGH